MKKLLTIGALLFSNYSYAGTLVVEDELVWSLDGNSDNLLLLEPTLIDSQIAGAVVIYQVTGAYGIISSQVVYPVFGSCIINPASWNSGEFARCFIWSEVAGATLIFDTNGNGTYTLTD